MASNGQELPQMEGYATTFDTDAYMKDYYPREYFVNITENRTDLNRAFDHLGFLPVYLQSWLAAFSQGKELTNYIVILHTYVYNIYIHMYKHSVQSFKYLHNNKYTCIHIHIQSYIHIHIHIYIGLHIFI